LQLEQGRLLASRGLPRLKQLLLKAPAAILSDAWRKSSSSSTSTQMFDDSPCAATCSVAVLLGISSTGGTAENRHLVSKHPNHPTCPEHVAWGFLVLPPISTAYPRRDLNLFAAREAGCGRVGMWRGG
jgi:hypothetical protein